MPSRRTYQSLKTAAKNLWRNKFLSVAAIATMALILFIFNIILSLNVLSTTIIEDIYEQVDVIVYLQDNADIFDINTMIEEITAIEHVLDVKYTTKEEALADYLELYPDQGNPFEKYGLENPLPANVQITTSSPDSHAEINTTLEQYDDLTLTTESNAENQSLIDQVVTIGTYTQNLILTIMLIFIITSFLIILNSMYLAIWNRKTEIEIMQLVGAPINSIRFPFIIEGIVISLAAALISLTLIGIFIASLNLPIQITSISTTGSLLIIILFEIIISVSIGILSSSMAIERHLRKTLQT